MKRVSVWNIAGVTRLPDGGLRVDYLTDGASRAACEPSSHRLIPLGDIVCPGCFPASYPAVARHRKDPS